HQGVFAGNSLEQLVAIEPLLRDVDVTGRPQDGGRRSGNAASDQNGRHETVGRLEPATASVAVALAVAAMIAGDRRLNHTCVARVHQRSIQAVARMRSGATRDRLRTARVGARETTTHRLTYELTDLIFVHRSSSVRHQTS